MRYFDDIYWRLYQESAFWEAEEAQWMERAEADFERQRTESEIHWQLVQSGLAGAWAVTSDFSQFSSSLPDEAEFALIPTDSGERPAFFRGNELLYALASLPAPSAIELAEALENGGAPAATTLERFRLAILPIELEQGSAE